MRGRSWTLSASSLLVLVLAFVSCNESKPKVVTTTASDSFGTHDNLNIEVAQDVAQASRTIALEKAKKRASEVHKKKRKEYQERLKHSSTTTTESYQDIDEAGELHGGDKASELDQVKIRASDGGAVAISEIEEEKGGRIFYADNQNSSSSIPPTETTVEEGIHAQGTHVEVGGGKCLKLNQDENQPFLTFSQETAPSSNNALLRHVTSLLNKHLEGVISVDISMNANSKHANVGIFIITAVITRIVKLENGKNETIDERFEIPYEITDIDECSLPPSHPMSHNCHPSTQCVNIVGSYECSCKRGSWGMKGSGSTHPQKWVVLRWLLHLGLFPLDTENDAGMCGGKANTSECCFHGHTYDDDPWIFVNQCKTNFRCTNDPCLGETCPGGSYCKPGAAYGDFSCTCKSGYKVSAAHVLSGLLAEIMVQFFGYSI